MSHVLVDMLSQITSVSEEERKDIEASFPIRTFDKGTYLLKEGQLSNNSYFVLEGCIRAYEFWEGEERTTAFYIENDSSIDFGSTDGKSTSKINFVCVEVTTVAIVNTAKEDALYRKHPRFESFCRKGMEQMMGEKQQHVNSLIRMSPEERYDQLLDEKPDLINRVPQYQIASYLGVKPETLSRIRRRKLKS